MYSILSADLDALPAFLAGVMPYLTEYGPKVAGWAWDKIVNKKTEDIM